MFFFLSLLSALRRLIKSIKPCDGISTQGQLPHFTIVSLWTGREEEEELFDLSLEGNWSLALCQGISTTADKENTEAWARRHPDHTLGQAQSRPSPTTGANGYSTKSVNCSEAQWLGGQMRISVRFFNHAVWALIKKWVKRRQFLSEVHSLLSLRAHTSQSRCLISACGECIDWSSTMPRCSQWPTLWL